MTKVHMTDVQKEKLIQDEREDKSLVLGEREKEEKVEDDNKAEKDVKQAAEEEGRGGARAAKRKVPSQGPRAVEEAVAGVARKEAPAGRGLAERQRVADVSRGECERWMGPCAPNWHEEASWKLTRPCWLGQAVREAAAVPGHEGQRMMWELVCGEKK